MTKFFYYNKATINVKQIKLKKKVRIQFVIFNKKTEVIRFIDHNSIDNTKIELIKTIFFVTNDKNFKNDDTFIYQKSYNG